MAKRTNHFTSFIKPREINFLKTAGVSFLLLCATPPFVVANDALENTAVTITQQSKTEKIAGRVVDENGETIIGASVKVQGNATIGTITNLEGEFTLEVPRKSIIEISFIGYKTLTVVIGREKDLRITLEEDTKTLDEVIVVGYGTTSKRKTTAAIASVNASDITKAPTANITQSLAGRAPGLLVNTSGGGLNNFSSISIRGGGEPLFVIDDVISEKRDFQNLNAEDIDQINILKDAASTAIYGARAANGIVMVVTKQGKAGKMSINYNFSYNWSQPANMPNKLNSHDAAFYKNMSMTNDGLAAAYTPDELELFRNGSDPKNYPNTDWQKLCLNNFAPEMQHNLTVTGGSEKVKSYTSFGYYDQNSLYKFDTNTYKRYNFRNNSVMDFKEIGLKVISSIEAYMANLKMPNAKTGGSNYSSTWGHIQNKAPWEKAYNGMGQIYNTPDNPLMEISPEAGYMKADILSVIGNLSVEWTVPGVPGLRLKGLGNYRINNDATKSWQKSPVSYDWDGNPNNPGKPSLSKSYSNWSNYTVQGLVNYDRTFNKVHTVSATAGIEAYKSFMDDSSLSREEYLLDVDQIGAGPVASAKNYSSEREQARAGVVARLKYDYASKYVAEASLRYDGSDNFPRGERWGTFYAGSLAWVMSEEAFWQPLKDKHIFDQFKVRASYGEIGLDNIGRYAYLQSYNLNERGYLLDNAWYPGFSEGALVSKDITWYTTRDFNAGLDFGSLNNRLSGSVDYFRKSTKGYLTSPSAVGYTAPLGIDLPKVKSNGEQVRQGAEFILQWKEKRGDFEYTISGNFTYFDEYWNVNPNESEVDLKNPYKRTTQAKGYWGIGYENLGFYQDQNDIMNSPKRPGSVNLGAGDLKFADFNGDGIIDGSDQHRIGKAGNPRGQYGFNIDLNYKGWFMSMLWQGATPADLYMGDIIRGSNSSGGYPPVIYDFQTDVWTPDNTDARYPRLRSNSNYNGANNYGNSTFWLINTGYLRLKTLNIGYDFKNRLLKKVAWLTKANVSLNGYNLVTFSGANKFNIDPEVGDGNLYSYPISRVYAISFNLGF